MPTVTFLDADGTEHPISGDIGQSAMEIGRREGIAGVVGECGGCAACGTCHVLVDPRWLGALLPMRQDEDDMLDFVTQRAPNSRLACQIRLTPALDGLILLVPAKQAPSPRRPAE